MVYDIIFYTWAAPMAIGLVVYACTCVAALWKFGLDTTWTLRHKPKPSLPRTDLREVGH